MSRLQEVFAEAQKYMIAGASAGQRYRKASGQPLYLSGASGCRLYDVDGNVYIDYHGGAGAAMFGHAHPRLRDAAMRAMEMGFFMNYDTEYTVECARLLSEIFPSCERMRFANTGSEATQDAIRLARTYTGKDIIVKFDGHFHGMHDLIWYNHSSVAPAGKDGAVETIPDCSGLDKKTAESIRVVLWNDVDALENCVRENRGRIAAVILEPISFNCGCLLPKEGYLQAVRDICTREGIVLIFDEVICGLRMAPGSAQAYFGVTPDMTTMAKAIGGGFPIAAFGGKKEIMDCLSPFGPCVVSGTYTGSLMPVVVSCECLKMSQEPGFYEAIEEAGMRLIHGINSLFAQNGLRGHARRVGARFSIYFGPDDPEEDYDFRKTAAKMDAAMYDKFIQNVLSVGLWFHDTASKITPAHYGFSTQHTLADIDETLDKLETVFKKMK